MTVSTQEIHLTQTLLFEFITVIHLQQHIDSCIYTAQTVIETAPHIIDIPVGGKDTSGDLQLMEDITIRFTVSAFVGVIRADIEVPHGERGVDILSRDEDSIG